MADHIQVQPASDAPRRSYIEAVNAAYADYFVPISLDDSSFDHIVVRESVVLEGSVAATLDGKVVGVGLLALRGQRAWIGGMGVIPRLRRQGIGRQMMRFLIEQARTRGVQTILLEVITRNTGAYQLYQSLGFQTTRRLLVLSRHAASLPPAFTEDGYSVVWQPPDQLLDRLDDLPGVTRCWQREAASYRPILDEINGYAALDPATQQVAGVLLYGGDSPQLGLADFAARSPEAGRALLAHLVSGMPATRLSYINVAEDDPMLPVMEEAGFTTGLDQYEMIYHLE